jgi:shikimate dehydrogenase
MPRLAVLGYPVSHSRSPAMQTAALRALGLEDEWSYGAIEVAPEGFEAKVRAMAAGDYAGANVTVPHKAAALAVADVVDEIAGDIGAANTLAFADGEVLAYNTDADGFHDALPEHLRWEWLERCRALVLGAGGAARAVIWRLNGAGAEVDVWNRTASRAEAVCAEMGGGSPVATPIQGEYDLVVNTTAVGLRGEDPFGHLPLSRERFDPRQVVVDMVYGERRSPLLAAAEEAGAATVDGLEILVQQGARSLEIWTGCEPDLDVMRRAAARR